jgi:hypothetical protein
MAPENMTANQARRVINRINTEISIRRQGVQNAMDNAVGAQLPVTDSTHTGTGPPKTSSAGVSGPVTITGDADYNALPSGTHFVGPDGHERIKP